MCLESLIDRGKVDGLSQIITHFISIFIVAATGAKFTFNQIFQHTFFHFFTSSIDFFGLQKTNEKLQSHAT